MKRRVVVTGIGCVTPIGNTVRDFSSALHNGRIGVGRLSLFDATHFPVRIAAEVRTGMSVRRAERLTAGGIALGKPSSPSHQDSRLPGNPEFSTVR